MIRRLGVFGSAGALLASAFLASSMSAARADSFEDWGAVSAGGSHTCGIRHEGKLYCWGYDFFGEVGDGDGPDTTASSPRRVGIFEDWATVSAGGNHTCGVRKNGKLYCWGDDADGQGGDGGTSEGAIQPPKRIGAFEDWAGVSAGANHSCGVRTNGELYCWGADDSAQVGDGEATADDRIIPVHIGAFEDWADAAAGGFHSCGVRENGKLYCWGDDEVGQVGNGADDGSNPALSPRRV